MANFEEATASGVSPLVTITSEGVQKLLKKNHEENDIFFGPHFHNHIPHAILTYFALGADQVSHVYNLCLRWDHIDAILKARLEKEYKIEKEDGIEPIRQEKGEITHENWKDHIGDDR